MDFGWTSVTHVVAAVWFTRKQPSDEAPIECVCGWAGQVKEWQLHRGQRLRDIGRRNPMGCHPLGLPGMPCQRCGRLLEMGETNPHNFSVRVRHVEAA